LPDFVRGPGQAAAQPEVAGGLPVRIYGAGTFSSVHFELHYDPATLQLTGVTSPTGGTVQADLSAPGVASITVSYASTVSGDGIEVARLAGLVPDTAAYGGKRVLEIHNVVVDGTRAGRGDDALQVVAFSGDATRDASYTSLDLQRMQRVVTKLDSGFGEWPLIDPAVVGDVSGNGQFNSSDVTIFLREINGIDRPEIPPIPTGIPPIQFAGADPVVSLPRVLTAHSGDRIVVPVDLDTGAGLESVQLRLAWDASTLTLTDVRRGSLTGDFQWFIQKHDEGQLIIDTSRLQALAGGHGSLVELEFQVSAKAKPGAQLIDLQWARLNDSHLTLGVVPKPGLDPTDAMLRIASPTVGTDRLAPARINPLPQAAPANQRAGDSGGGVLPLIDWSGANQLPASALPELQSGNGEWLEDFLNKLGKSEEQRNPNTRLRIPWSHR